MTKEGRRKKSRKSKKGRRWEERGEDESESSPLTVEQIQLHRPMTAWFCSKIGGVSATGLGEVQNTKCQYDAKVTRREVWSW